MRLKHLATASAGAMLLAGVASLTALGATPPSLRVIPNPTPAGDRPTAYGSGFCSTGCSAVRITAGGEAIADGIAVGADGTFAHPFTVSLSPGQYLVVASQTDATGATLQASTGMTVVPNDATARTPPPTTAAASPHASPAGTTRPPSPSGTSGLGSTTPSAPPLASPSVAASPSAPAPSPGAAAVGAARPASRHGRLPWILAAVVLLAGLGGALAYGLRRARSTR